MDDGVEGYGKGRGITLKKITDHFEDSGLGTRDSGLRTQGTARHENTSV